MKDLFKRRKLKNQSFKIILDQNWYRPEEILKLPTGAKLKVIKTYPFNWWRRLLFKLGFSYTSSKVIKVENIYEEL